MIPVTNDCFELYLKSLLEPVFVICFGYIAPSLEKEGFNLIVTGGDAINYYLPSDKQYLTHDFDLRIFTIPHKNISEYNMEIIGKKLLDIINFFNHNFTIALNELKNNIKVIQLNKEFHNMLSEIKFRSVLTQNLCQLKFTYEHNNIIVENTIIDLFLYTEGQEKSPHILHQSVNFNKSKREITDWMRKYGYMIHNEIEFWVKDVNTGVQYMSLGDIIADTSRMIFWSYRTYRNNTNDRGNKINKYIEKYTRLVYTVNNMLQEFKCTVDDMNKIFLCKRNNTKEEKIYDETIFNQEIQKYYISPIIINIIPTLNMNRKYAIYIGINNVNVGCDRMSD
mgnify:CR=1 FL=1